MGVGAGGVEPELEKRGGRIGPEVDLLGYLVRKRE